MIERTARVFERFGAIPGIGVSQRGECMGVACAALIAVFLCNISQPGQGGCGFGILTSDSECLGALQRGARVLILILNF